MTAVRDRPRPFPQRWGEMFTNVTAYCSVMQGKAAGDQARFLCRLTDDGYFAASKPGCDAFTCTFSFRKVSRVSRTSFFRLRSAEACA